MINISIIDGVKLFDFTVRNKKHINLDNLHKIDY